MYLCLSGREFVSNAGDKGDVGVTPGSGRSPDEGNGSPLQYSCWENSMGTNPFFIVVEDRIIRIV